MIPLKDSTWMLINIINYCIFFSKYRCDHFYVTYITHVRIWLTTSYRKMLFIISLTFNTIAKLSYSNDFYERNLDYPKNMETCIEYVQGIKLLFYSSLLCFSIPLRQLADYISCLSIQFEDMWLNFVLTKFSETIWATL